MYCVKCKRATGTNNIERVVTKNNRNMLRGSVMYAVVLKHSSSRQT